MRFQRKNSGRLSPNMAEVLPPRPQPRLPIGISDCLLGAEVRYDGSHKRSAFPHAELDGLFDYTGFCPEVAIGLGTPRETIRLEGVAANPRALSRTQRQDVTEQLAAYGTEVLPQIEPLAGYVFMKNSPSCGLFRVKVYGEKGIPFPAGRGIYAAVVAAGLPNLPVEESGRLQDPVLRENFVMRVFVFAHWQALQRSGISAAKLIEFHSRYKYLLMAHSVNSYRALGRLLSDLSSDLEATASHYIGGLMQGLAQPATRGGHANVLSHLQGYVKQQLSGEDRRELADLIDQFRQGSVPLLAAIALLQHHLKHHANDYALGQIYLDPHPAVAGLRRSL